MTPKFDEPQSFVDGNIEYSYTLENLTAPTDVKAVIQRIQARVKEEEKTVNARLNLAGHGYNNEAGRFSVVGSVPTFFKNV